MPLIVRPSQLRTSTWRRHAPSAYLRFPNRQRRPAATSPEVSNSHVDGSGTGSKVGLLKVEDTAAFVNAVEVPPWYATGLKNCPFGCRPVGTNPVDELSSMQRCVASKEQGGRLARYKGESGSTTASKGGV